MIGRGVPKILPQWEVPDFLREGVPIFQGRIAYIVRVPDFLGCKNIL